MPGPATRPSSAVTTPRSEFIAGLAKNTGLSVDVVTAWVNAEGPDSKGAYGGFNFLNLSAKGASGWSGVPIAGTYASNAGTGSFAKFHSVQDAVTETSWWINNMGNYRDIKASAGKPPVVQLGAIARSPWDAGHYGGNGQHLINDYRAVKGGKSLGVSGFVGGVAHGVSSGIGDVVNAPAHAAESVAKGAIGYGSRILLDVILFVGGLLLIYSGVRRLSGDALPSTVQIVSKGAEAGAAAAAA